MDFSGRAFENSSFWLRVFSDLTRIQVSTCVKPQSKSITWRHSHSKRYLPYQPRSPWIITIEPNGPWHFGSRYLSVTAAFWAIFTNLHNYKAVKLKKKNSKLWDQTRNIQSWHISVIPIHCTIIGFEASGGFVTRFLGHKVAALSLVPKCLISPIDMAIRKTPELAPSPNSVRRNNKMFAPI